MARDHAVPVAADEVAVTEEAVEQLTLSAQEGDKLKLEELNAFGEGRALRLAKHITTQLARLAA